MNPLEEFFNRQSEAFWEWRPLRRLRPRPGEEISAGTFLRLLPLVACAALGLIVFVFALGAAADAASAGTLLARGGELTFLRNLRVIFTMISFRIVFLTLFVSYGLMLLSLPYLFFWNRRARRLGREPMAPDTSPGVWPPPPSVPRSS